MTKSQCRTATHKAIKNGILKLQPCNICGMPWSNLKITKGHIYIHHPNYEDPMKEEGKEMKSVIIRDIRTGEIIVHIRRTKNGVDAKILKSLAGTLEIKVIAQNNEVIKIRS